MSTFEVKVYKIAIEPHPNADAIELAVVGDYRSIVRKGQFKTGDLAAYIPEASLVPDWLIEKLGLVGKLAGPQHNRVKAIKLRGIVSQGLIVSADILAERFIDSDEDEGQEWCEFLYVGADLAEFLGITKWEPPIPVHMAGEVWNAYGMTLKYDIENIKKYPHVFNEDELVLVTEKLHGTWTCFGYNQNSEVPIVTSKGLSGQGLAFKFNEENEGNLYVKMYKEVGETLLNNLRAGLAPGLNVYILGEIYGKGVQDLRYGTTKPAFRAFDIFVSSADGEGRYLTGAEFTLACREAGIETVPVLGHGCFTRARIAELTNGKDTIAGANIREGIVIRPLIENRRDPEIGRVILKSVSEAYLLRSGDATEFN